MPLQSGQQRFLERFFPGLIADVLALGPGEVEADTPKVKTRDGHIRDVQLNLKSTMADGTVVEIRTHSRIRANEKLLDPTANDAVDLTKWERYRYSLHYGSSFANCLFRFDLDLSHGYHVHMRPNTDIHVPANDVDPDTRDMDPREFVRIVAKFRRDKSYPVTRKKP